MTMRGGQAHVQRFWHMLLDKIVKGARAHRNTATQHSRTLRVHA